ncbi:MAG: alpha/beta hydrolase-fold protein [Planctomycetota bacterium]|nr:alpha/beta hydrolase-fold protein [Planctomycetota bacterium]
MQEIIVVSIETTTRRLDRLGPVPDADHGGGRAEDHLAAMVGELKPHVDRTLRTRTGPKSTALLGSSMGGLFSFYAAWKRPDVFGSAVCLSSSFWWADRWAIRHAQSGTCPSPRPLLYIDSGAACSALDRDANARDGQHHTRAMERALVGHCYEPGKDLHVLTFPGHRHDSTSWAARVAIPLQLVFPRGHG